MIDDIINELRDTISNIEEHLNEAHNAIDEGDLDATRHILRKIIDLCEECIVDDVT